MAIVARTVHSTVSSGLQLILPGCGLPGLGCHLQGTDANLTTPVGTVDRSLAWVMMVR